MEHLISIELSITEWFKVIKALDAYQDILTRRNEIIDIKTQVLDTIDITNLIEEQMLYENYNKNKVNESH